MPQSVLRASKNRVAAPLALELLYGRIQRTPALGIGGAPERGLSVEWLEIIEPQTDLAHRLRMPCHHFIKEPLEYRVDHGVAKLWMVKAMHRSALGEIREAHRQTQLPCLQPSRRSWPIIRVLSLRANTSAAV